MTDKKKEKIKQLAAQESPKLSRKGIADLVGCSPAFVTQTLGPVRRYKARRQEQEPQAVPEGQ